MLNSENIEVSNAESSSVQPKWPELRLFDNNCGFSECDRKRWIAAETRRLNIEWIGYMQRWKESQEHTSEFCKSVKKGSDAAEPGNILSVK